MGKKSEHIRIRADEELKKALKEAAERECRTEADQARYIILSHFGLLPVAEGKKAYRPNRGSPQKDSGATRDG